MNNAECNIRLHVILALYILCVLILLLLIIPLEVAKIVLDSKAASLISIWIRVNAFSLALSFSFSIVLRMILMPLRLL